MTGAVDAGPVGDSVVGVRDHEHASDRHLGILVVLIEDGAAVGSPRGLRLVEDAPRERLDPGDLVALDRRDRGLVAPAHVRRERDACSVGGPVALERLAIDVAGLELRRCPAFGRDHVEVAVRAHGLAPGGEHEALSVRRPAGSLVVEASIVESALLSGRDVHHVDREGLAVGVRDVRDARAVRRPRDVAMHDVGLVGDVALGLAVAVDEPDIEALVPARVA